MMSVNIIDIIHKKYLQARKALYKNTLNLTSAIGGGNKTRDKINRFNLLSVLVSYVEGKSRPSTKVEGKDTTYIALEDIQIEAYIGSPPGEGSLEGGPQGFFTFAKNPLHLYTTDVYGNTATIAYLEPNWGLSNGTNGLAEIFTGVLTDSITVFGIVSNVIPYTTGVETNAQIHLAVERLKANIVNAVNSRDSVFSAALSNGVVKIKARDTALYNGSSIESSSRGISFTSSPRLFVKRPIPSSSLTEKWNCTHSTPLPTTPE